MSRCWLALLLAIAAAAGAYFDPWESVSREWLATVALPPPETATAIETTGAATPMDAALILRAVLRYQPRSVAFLDPIAGNDGMPYLLSKLADARLAVEFVPGTRLPPLPRVGVVPAVAAGAMNSLAARYVNRISLDELMLRTERSERGEIAIALENLFRNKVVMVEEQGSRRSGALLATLNGCVATEFPRAGWVAVIIAATLPWWRLGRPSRALAALGFTCAWLLLAMSLYAQFRVAIPLNPVLLLPILALVPAGPKFTR